ncbi:MAG TPA: wax ester/triacylglycerol synthase family O-acyltransferase [Thermoanaerobaculia bacterium]|nr:wax ester/triacylglycerol synthase family O-acyltransferase [Thermoanaerobaculia bacterium]
MPDNVHDGTPLTYVDTAWLHMEDPTNLMMVTGIFIFDGPLDLARVRDTLQARMVDRFPRLRHRVKQDGSSAHWVEDPTFSLDAHVHKMALPAPGDLGTLRDVVSDLMSTPLDFTKPLWQCHYIEGLGAGSAILLRFHHCIGDGVALVHVILSLTDAAADAPRPRRTRLLAHETHVGERIVSLFDEARSAVERTVGATRKVTGAILEEGVETLLHPSHVLDIAQTTTEAAGVLLKLILKPADSATLLKGHLGVAKRAAWSRPLRLDEVKAVGKSVDGTVNDVLLTAVAGALRRYLLQRGDRADGVEINAMVPVNLRPLSEADQLGNRFGLIYLALPVGTRDRPERLRLVKTRMDEIKSSPQPFVTFQILNALGLAPAEVAGLAVNMFGTKATAVMTNVIGPKQPLYFAGERIRTWLGWVPQSGHMGLGVSIFSYDGQVVLGVASDKGLVPDPESIASAFEEEFEALVEWARGTGATGAATKRKKAGPVKNAT